MTATEAATQAVPPGYPTVVIVGSGPTGAAYARKILEGAPRATVLMVEAGPQVTTPAGMNVKNVADPADQARARAASQGRAAGSGVAGIPGGVVVEGTITAREGTHPIGRSAPGSTGLPAAAGATCIGGQGVHWTCATPEPRGSERIDFIDAVEWDGHIADAARLLGVTAEAFESSPQAGVILDTLRREFAADELVVRPLPVAAQPRGDGGLQWSGVDTVLGDAIDDPRFELRANTVCTRVLRDWGRAIGVLVRDVATGVEEVIPADHVVLAADALRTPQLLWASDIRPEALGRYLTEHPLLFGVVALKQGLVPPPDADDGADPIRAIVAVSFDDELHPFSAQFMYRPICPIPLPENSRFRDNPGGYAGCGWGLRKFPRAQDRLTFDESTPDEFGLPGIVIAYELTEREEAEIERARAVQARAVAALGEFVDGMPKLMPPGSSIHYMGTLRMGAADDGTSVCDEFSRVWGVPGLQVAGNGVIPTANSCNPTLTSVAIACRGAENLCADINRAEPASEET